MLLCDRLRCCLDVREHVDDADLCSLGSESARQRVTDSSTATRDDCGFSRQPHRNFSIGRA
jgi:hypothetical protein